MLRSKLISLLAILWSIPTVGQFGNEWINLNQEYFTFKLAKDDFYRVTREELEAVGFPVGAVPASRIQLFREGEEIALNVSLNADNTIDYLEFYGKKRDGSSDEALYLPGTQPHPYYNLFTDSATYFLTYLLGSGSGKRMGFSADQNTTGLTPELYHLKDSLAVFSESYAVGRSVAENITLGDYDNGEGWTDLFIRKNQSRSYELTLDGLTDQGNIRFETVLFGGNNLAHRVNLLAGPDASSLEILGTSQFTGRTSTIFVSNILRTTIGIDNALSLQVFDEGFPDQTDVISVGYILVTYPQALSVSSTQNKVFNLDDITNRRAWLQIGTTNAPDFRVFNVTDPANSVRFSSTNFSDRIEVVVSDVGTSNKIMVVSNPASVGTIKKVMLPNYELSGTDYLIITHPLLRSGEDQVAAYETYRESEDGGSYNVQVAEIQDLYNLYSYGDPTPLAISNFIRYANGISQIGHVFIIGKGFKPFLDNNPSNVTDLVAPARIDSSFVYVPTYGNPGSDMMFVLGINADERIPGIPIGRLNATEPSQIASYLEKVAEMEALPFDDLFRKDFLQLSGGLNQSEIDDFSKIIRDLGAVVEDDFVGGRTFNTGKQSNQNVEFIDISDRVNEGVGYITFFGHSSGTVSDIEVGLASDPSFGFINKGKYPIFLVNGCDAGGIFNTSFTYGEDWIFEPDKGAINFIAHTSRAFSETLERWSGLYYQLGFADDEFISRSVGEVMIEASKRYWETNKTETDLTQIRQMQLQGDPAYRIFGADFPDYEIDNNGLSASAIGANEILSIQDSFKLDIIVRNFGRTISDSLKVLVNRTFPDGSMATYVDMFERPRREDTLTFIIPIPEDLDNDGSNVLTIILDPDNQQEELNETNNQGSIEVSIFSGNTFNLFPIDNGIVSSEQVEFLWQSSSLLEETRAYDLEFDSQPGFDGANLRTFTVSGEVLMRQFFDFASLTLEDTTTIYWRTRFADPRPDESDQWVNSSFTLIDNAGTGWGQHATSQLLSGNISGISFNEVAGQWEFNSSSSPLDFFTFGAENTTFGLEDVRTIVDGVNLIFTTNPFDPQCSENTFNIIAFDKESGDPFNPILVPTQDVLSTAVCGRRPQRIYQFADSLLTSLDSRFPQINFIGIVEAMEVGDQMIMFNIGNVDYSSWEPEVISAMNEMGVSNATISALTDGQPVIFFGKKGAPLGSAIVVTSDGSADPVTEQSISLQENVVASFTSGTLQSSRIGPANSWESFTYDFGEESNDNVTLDVIGIRPDGGQEVLFTQGRTEFVDVSNVDATLYPALELSLQFNDETDQTPPQLNFWQINYEQPADAMLLPAVKQSVTFREGEEISRSLRLVNTSSFSFSDSLSVMASLINQSTGAMLERSFRVAAPMPNDTTLFDVTFTSINMGGLNNLVVEASANENEAYGSNNRFTLAGAIEVKADETNPIIDVTFDGFHILNGDVVSPNPTISVRMRDDNPLLLKTDTVGFNISLRMPGEESQFQRISFSDPRVQFIPASEGQDFEVEFQPGPLEDGVYGLQILAEDESGNGIRSVDDPYEIEFEVINESTITHFYPYPNPFSTNCRFVFTLTGSEVPSQLKIQIMTVSGRIVREITQDEIGPIRIGNNITSYAWDGRDHYGDQLANGVYFYKVFIGDAGANDFAHRFTSADRTFKNGFGKLYILR